MRVDPRIKRALEATGLSWSIERGGKHRRIKLDGRIVGALPSNDGDKCGRHVENVVSQVRRAAKAAGGLHALS